MPLIHTLWEYLKAAKLPINEAANAVVLWSSLLANAILLWAHYRSHVSKYVARKRLSIFWGSNKGQRIFVTFSRFPIDDPNRFGSERTVTHIGDAQALPIITTMA